MFIVSAAIHYYTADGYHDQNRQLFAEEDAEKGTGDYGAMSNTVDVETKSHEQVRDMLSEQFTETDDCRCCEVGCLCSMERRLRQIPIIPEQTEGELQLYIRFDNTKYPVVVSNDANVDDLRREFIKIHPPHTGKSYKFQYAHQDLNESDELSEQYIICRSND